ncbi:MAG: acyl-CoA thioesterase [Verrucomicrobia bacterium]|nr:acyl-CoA thioesterase [Verrucomicrobiota bacterium]
MVFHYPIRTRYSETGQDGIIHHSAYVVYLEVARVEFFKKMGLDINELEKEGMLCPVVDLSLKYQKPLYSLEDIVVEVTIGEVSKVKFSLNYRVMKGDACAATATVSHCIIDRSFKPIAIPKKFLESLSL